MKRLMWIGALLVVGLPLAAWSQDSAESSPELTGERPVLKTTAEKRAWLRNEMVRGLNHPREIAEVQTRLNRMTPKQIDALTNITLAQQIPQNQAADVALQQAQFELQRARWLRQMLENELWWQRYNSVGYMPVIGWLPEGTHLGASAVVSPDRRYVRVSPTPFFSSVGPVYSYNLNTGQTRLMPQYGYGTPPYMYWPRGGGYRSGEIPNLPGSSNSERAERRDPPRVFTDSYWGRR
ncbi:MAG: hypothetical protein KJ000_08615 [Pirellulaceae bacterium]|nr:hypothetical protein [Pirellulaceae bacterium]